MGIKENRSHLLGEKGPKRMGFIFAWKKDFYFADRKVGIRGRGNRQTKAVSW